MFFLLKYYFSLLSNQKQKVLYSSISTEKCLWFFFCMCVTAIKIQLLELYFNRDHHQQKKIADNFVVVVVCNFFIPFHYLLAHFHYNNQNLYTSG